MTMPQGQSGLLMKPKGNQAVRHAIGERAQANACHSHDQALPRDLSHAATSRPAKVVGDAAFPPNPRSPSRVPGVSSRRSARVSGHGLPEYPRGVAADVGWIGTRSGEAILAGPVVHSENDNSATNEHPRRRPEMTDVTLISWIRFQSRSLRMCASVATTTRAWIR